MTKIIKLKIAFWESKIKQNPKCKKQGLEEIVKLKNEQYQLKNKI